MQVFAQIKKTAKQRKISIKQIAAGAGLAPNTVYKWKNQIPSSRDLEKVANYLHVSVDYLLGRKVINANEPIDLTDNRIFTYEGKPISEEEMTYIKRILTPNDRNEPKNDK